MEYKNRTAALMKHLQEGKFVEFDEDELLKLKALQHRATQYIMYYTKVSNRFYFDIFLHYTLG